MTFRIVASLPLFFLLVSCGEPETVSTVDTSKRDSVAPDINRADVNHSCCFQNESEFDQFFPAMAGNFQRQEFPRIALKCVTDTLTHSSAMYGYANTESHLINVTLADYCSAPDNLRTDYTLKYEKCKTSSSSSEFNEFDVPPSHHGFTHFDAKMRTATLVVLVDDRFLIEIDDQVCENTKNVLAIYDALPLDSLAGFGKR